MDVAFTKIILGTLFFTLNFGRTVIYYLLKKKRKELYDAYNFTMAPATS